VWVEVFGVNDELYAFAGQGVECQGIVGSDEVGAQFTHGYVVECLSVLGAALPDGLADVLFQQPVVGCCIGEHTQQCALGRGERLRGAVPVADDVGVEAYASIAYYLHAAQAGYRLQAVCSHGIACGKQQYQRYLPSAHPAHVAQYRVAAHGHLAHHQSLVADAYAYASVTNPSTCFATSTSRMGAFTFIECAVGNISFRSFTCSSVAASASMPRLDNRLLKSESASAGL